MTSSKFCILILDSLKGTNHIYMHILLVIDESINKRVLFCVKYFLLRQNIYFVQINCRFYTTTNCTSACYFPLLFPHTDLREI